MIIEKNIQARFTHPSSHYKSALYATLKTLSPKYCFEIGTNYGGSAEVFQAYFNESQPEGVLLSCDIKQYTDLAHLANCHFVQVHSWIKNPQDFHFVKDEDLLTKGDSSNLKIVLDKMDELNIKEWDFIFIDGDHTEYSVSCDLMMCASLPHKFPRYTFMDNVETKGKGHEVIYVYDKIRQNQAWGTYDYDNWNVNVEAGLIWQKSQP